MSNLLHLFQQGIPFSPSHYFIIFIAIIFPFLFSLFCAAAISRIGHRLALIDNPNIRSSHSLPTPRGGGIGIWLAFVIIGFFFFKDNAFDYSIQLYDNVLMYILCGCRCYTLLHWSVTI